MHVIHARLLPAAEAAVLPRSHSSAPYKIGQDRKPGRPIGHETEDHQADPGRLAQIIQFGCDAHRRSHVNVTYIHIIGVWRRSVKTVDKDFRKTTETQRHRENEFVLAIPRGWLGLSWPVVRRAIFFSVPLW